MRPLCLGSPLNTNSLSLQPPEISIPASSHFIILPPVIALQLYPCWYLCGRNPCGPNKTNAQAKLVPFVRSDELWDQNGMIIHKISQKDSSEHRFPPLLRRLKQKGTICQTVTLASCSLNSITNVYLSLQCLVLSV